MALWMIAMACRPDDKESAAGADLPTPYDPSGYLPAEDAAAFDGDAVGAAMSGAAAAALSYDPEALFAAYDEAMAGADAGCPTYSEVDGNAFWYGYCTSADGTLFDGYALYNAFTDYPYGTYTMAGASLYGQVRIVDADGHTFEVGGLAYALSGPSSDGSILSYASFLGSFSSDGDAALGTWMEDGAALDLLVYAVDFPSYDGRAVLIDGGLSGLAGDYGAVDFDQALFMQRNLGSSCEDEPGGTVSVRGSDAHWVDVAFDGPDPDTMESGPGECDGCGAATLLDLDEGEACADFSAVYDWQETPW
jgi:hypothetical protein